MLFLEQIEGPNDVVIMSISLWIIRCILGLPFSTPISNWRNRHVSSKATAPLVTRSARVAVRSMNSRPLVDYRLAITQDDIPVDAGRNRPRA